MAAANSTKPIRRLSYHPLYKRWESMCGRCKYQSAPNFSRYGGRGITVCDEWRNDPAAFIAWAEANGYAPGLEIDRIDNDGPYAPGNCQFITHAANMRKRCNSKCDEQKVRALIEAMASGASTREAARAAGISKSLAWSIKSGQAWRGV